MYRWWVFVHVLGVAAFLMLHGVSIFVMFRVRAERDPRKIAELLELSSSTIPPFYAATGVLLLGGVVAGFLGDWWGRAWIWASIGILVATTIAMFGMARPYFRRVRFVSRAMADGSQVVSEDQLAGILRSGRPTAISVVGFAGLLAILFLMLFKPTLGFGAEGPGTASGGTGPIVTIGAVDDTAFDSDRLQGPADTTFRIVFDNQDPGTSHNVAIYTDPSASEAVFVGQLVQGPTTVTYQVPKLTLGSYFFRCDLHPQMNGTLDVR